MLVIVGPQFVLAESARLALQVGLAPGELLPVVLQLPWLGLARWTEQALPEELH